MAEKVSPGQLVSANPLVYDSSTVNRTLEAVDFHHTNVANGRGVKPPLRNLAEPCIIDVQNDSGGDLARGKVLQLGTKLLTDLDNDYLWFNGDTPADPQAAAKCCILLQPILDGDTGPALIAGACIASIDVSDDTHTHARPVDGSNDLESGTAGPYEILTPLSVASVHEAVVRFTGANLQFDRIEGLTTGAVAGGATFTINTIKVRQGLDPRTDTTSAAETVEVHNRFSEHANSGAICFAEWNEAEQRWENYFLQSICPPGA